MRMDASSTKDRSLAASLSYRVATRRHCLILGLLLAPEAAVHPGSLFLRPDHKGQRATGALHRMPFARLPNSSSATVRSWPRQQTSRSSARAGSGEKKRHPRRNVRSRDRLSGVASVVTPISGAGMTVLNDKTGEARLVCERADGPHTGRQSGGELDAACVVYCVHVGEVAVRTDKH
jgi:hypothetical protein